MSLSRWVLVGRIPLRLTKKNKNVKEIMNCDVFYNKNSISVHLHPSLSSPPHLFCRTFSQHWGGGVNWYTSGHIVKSFPCLTFRTNKSELNSLQVCGILFLTLKVVLISQETADGQTKVWQTLRDSSYWLSLKRPSTLLTDPDMILVASVC